MTAMLIWIVGFLLHFIAAIMLMRWGIKNKKVSKQNVSIEYLAFLSLVWPISLFCLLFIFIFEVIKHYALKDL